MECINWFIEGYKRLTGKTVLAVQVGYEAVELAQEEIGYEFIPEEDLGRVPVTPRNMSKDIWKALWRVKSLQGFLFLFLYKKWNSNVIELKCS
ncbi:hypothetical protein QYG89_07710 [Bacillus sp. B190/17]|uniref:Uncharacterized protein n=1 Tax=Bacillus lumedeiriae TaxID=3058829 RepID=A0ABW8I8T6_9BACI